VDFVGADAVFRIGEHPEGRKPLIQSERRVFKNGPDFRAELATARRALPDTARLQKHRISRIAARADNAVGPAHFDHEGQRAVRIREIDHRIGGAS